MRDPEYTEDRLYWASVKRFTKLLEGDEDVDPKIIGEIVKFLDNASIRPADISSLDADDPAAVMARKLAKSKGR